MKTRIIAYLILLSTCYIQTEDLLLNRLERFKNAYPDHILEVHEQYIVWQDGTCMPLENNLDSTSDQEKLNNPSLRDHLLQPVYNTGKTNNPPDNDSGRIRYEPFFLKMYGNSAEEVAAHLGTVDWMPAIFGKGTYVLQVTRINGVDKKIEAISNELELLALKKANLIIYLGKPETYVWRVIANSGRLSAHSFGMTFDINPEQTEYWQWDLAAAGQFIHENTILSYRNTVPWEIVEIFEKYGFIWGGKWYHYDTMHFEYRPELFA